MAEPLREVMQWTARQVHTYYDDVLRSWPKTLRVEIDALGDIIRHVSKRLGVRARDVEWALFRAHKHYQVERLYRP